MRVPFGVRIVGFGPSPLGTERKQSGTKALWAYIAGVSRPQRGVLCPKGVSRPQRGERRTNKVGRERKEQRGPFGHILRPKGAKGATLPFGDGKKAPKGAAPSGPLCYICPEGVPKDSEGPLAHNCLPAPFGPLCSRVPKGESCFARKGRNILTEKRFQPFGPFGVTKKRPTLCRRLRSPLGTKAKRFPKGEERRIYCVGQLCVVAVSC